MLYRRLYNTPSARVLQFVAAINSLRESRAPFAKGDTVVLPGSVWIVTALAG